MIVLPRNLVRQLRQVLRHTLVDLEPRRQWPVVLVRSGSRGLQILAQKQEHAVCYEQRGSQAEDTLALDAEPLAQLEGSRPDPITMESTGQNRARACWQEHGTPVEINLDTRAPESFQDFPAFPRRCVPLPENFRSALAAASATTAQESVRFALQLVQWRGRRGELVATDGRQLLIQGGFRFPWPEDLLVPPLPVLGKKTILPEASMAVGRTETHVALRLGPWSFLLPIQSTARFPEVDGVLPSEASLTGRLHMGEQDAKVLLGVLADKCAPEHCRAMLTLGSNIALELDMGDHQPRRRMELAHSRHQGQPLQVAFDRRYLQRALQLGFRHLGFARADTPVLCRKTHAVYVWVPLALQNAASAATQVPPPTTNGTAPEEKLPAQLPERTIMPRPIPNGQPTNTPQPQEPPDLSRPMTLGEVLNEAEELRQLLQHANQRLSRLVTALKQRHKHDQALRSAMESLRQLPIER